MRNKNKIDFDYLPAFEDFFLSKKRIVLLLGGAGSGKSYAVAQKIVLRLITPDISDQMGSSDSNHINKKQYDTWAKAGKPCNWLVIRQTATSHKDSTYNVILSIIDKMGLTDEFEVNKKEMRIKCKRNGNTCVFKGLDDPEKLKSIYGISNIWVEEVTETKKEAVDELFFRMREICNYNQIVMTLNPVSPRHWVKELWDAENDDVLKIKTTWEDNHFLPDEYKSFLRKQYPEGTYRHTVYVLGQWGSVKSTSALFSSFDDVHIRHLKYDPDLPLHISLDFNVQPHSVCLCFQINEKTKEVYLVDEIICEFPATSKKLALLFCRKYKNHSSKIFVYGDSSGTASTAASDKSNFQQVFDILHEHYQESMVVRKLLTKNPDIIRSASWVNYILDMNFEYRFFIHAECDTTMDDVMNLKADRNGSKLIEMGKNQEGVSYEKWGHSCDCIRYFLVSQFYDSYNKFISKSAQPILFERKESQLSGEPIAQTKALFGGSRKDTHGQKGGFWF